MDSVALLMIGFLVVAVATIVVLLIWLFVASLWKYGQESVDLSLNEPAVAKSTASRLHLVVRTTLLLIGILVGTVAGVSSFVAIQELVGADHASMTFTPTNWNTPQTVTITGVDDALVDGDVAYTIVIAAATSTDPEYDGLDADDVSVTFDWATVDNAGNAADDTGYGSVDYNYRISKHEVTNAQYTIFLNAVAATDPFSLYNFSMGNNPRGGITRSGSPGMVQGRLS